MFLPMFTGSPESIGPIFTIEMEFRKISRGDEVSLIAFRCLSYSGIFGIGRDERIPIYRVNRLSIDRKLGG